MKAYSWPEGHWAWPVKLTHQHGVRVGPYVYSGGQADLDTNGHVRHPENLLAQTDSVMAYLRAILVDFGTDYHSLIKLTVYFVGDHSTRSEILKQVGSLLGPDVKPAISLVALPALCYPGMVIELEGIAYIESSGSSDQLDIIEPTTRDNFNLSGLPQLPDAFSHAVRAGDYLFTSDLYACDDTGLPVAVGNLEQQSHLMMERLSQLLKSCGASLSNVLKLNVYYVGDGTSENWEPAARVRAGYFNDAFCAGEQAGPAATGLCLASLCIPGQLTSISVVANANETIEQEYAWPEDHWDWTTPLPYQHGTKCGSLIHVGGQVSLDTYGKAIDPDDMVTQTRTAMKNLENVLREFGATLDDVIKITTFYRGSASAEALHENLMIRSGSYSAPGPATSGIPMPSLVYEHMVIEIEATAMVEV